MSVKFQHIYILLFLLAFVACRNSVPAPNVWGETEADDGSAAEQALQFADLQANGELIITTISGPDTYYEYHGRGMGLHYLLVEKFCQTVGLQLRVDVCKDTADMLNRVKMGEADVAVMPFTKTEAGLKACAGKASSGKWHWLVNQDNSSLADTLTHWLTQNIVAAVEKEQTYWLSAASIRRHVYSPMQNRAKGIISNYDYLFQRYAPVAGCDWHLLAAQCYQESTFDPRARSWAGACGLMQIMPTTADHLGLPRSEMYNPEKNVAAAARYMAELTAKFNDIQNPSERIKFVLASYNGGAHHIRDAMALAKKHGQSPHSWTVVRNYVLGLARAEYYNDPVVKYGYMRGSETADYVDRIWERWMYYRGNASAPSAKSKGSSAKPGHSASPSALVPHPSAKRKEKYEL